MNESAPESTSLRSDCPSAFLDDDRPEIGIDEESPDDASGAASPGLRPREGLPVGFRMRHDAHYVEELTARSVQTQISRPDAVARSEQRSGDDTPAVQEGAGQWETVSRLEALATQVEAATRYGFRSAAVVDAFRVELSRATRVARAAALIASPPVLTRREARAQEIVEQVVERMSTDCRLAGVPLRTIVESPGFRIPVDVPLIAQALEGTIDAALAMIEHAAAGDRSFDASTTRLTLRVHALTPRPALVLELTQDSCPLSPTAVSRFFDAGFAARAGGVSSAVLVAAAARIVRLHGGRADARREGDVGSTVTFVVPQSVRDSPDERR